MRHGLRQPTVTICVFKSILLRGHYFISLHHTPFTSVIMLIPFALRPRCELIHVSRVCKYEGARRELVQETSTVELVYL